jgi:KRI1-like family
LLNQHYKGLIDLDLDGDWDPEKHDRQMAGLYDDDEDDEVRSCVLLNHTRIIIFL